MLDYFFCVREFDRYFVVKTIDLLFTFPLSSIIYYISIYFILFVHVNLLIGNFPKFTHIHGYILFFITIILYFFNRNIVEYLMNVTIGRFHFLLLTVIYILKHEMW